MPVYDLSYRHLEHAIAPPSGRFWVVARLHILERLGRRWFDLLIGVAMLPLLVDLIRILVELRFPEWVAQVKELTVGPGAFLQLLRWQMLFAFVVAIFSGSGIISGDLRTRALPLYLSKPISRVDYVLGKLLVPSFFIALVTLVPVELLWVFRVLTTEGGKFFIENPLLPLRIALASSVIVLVMSVLMLALSSLSRSSWLPGLGFAMLYLFSGGFANLLHLLFRSDLPYLLSLRQNILRVAEAIFGNPPATGPSWIFSLAVLAGIVAASLGVLHVRIRGVEVVTS